MHFAPNFSKKNGIFEISKGYDVGAKSITMWRFAPHHFSGIP
jgi:hypothetical protein